MEFRLNNKRFIKRKIKSWNGKYVNDLANIKVTLLNYTPYRVLEKYIPELVTATWNENIQEFRDTLLYGLGYYTALHMHTLCDGDYKNYMKEFYNFISSRKEAGIEDSITNLGISFEDYLSSKMIAPIIEENALTLKKKYNL